MEKSHINKLLFALFLFFVVRTTNASTIDFEGLLNEYGPFIDGVPVISGGFTFSPATLHSHSLSIPFPAGNGTTYFAVDDDRGNNPVTVRKTNNETFLLNSMDIGEWFEPSSQLLITGYIDPLVTVSRILEIDGISGPDINGFQNFVFGAEWSNLRYLTIDSMAGISTQGWSMDNFTYDENPQVPEPGTMLLLGSLATGLFGFAGLRKRHIN